MYCVTQLAALQTDVCAVYDGCVETGKRRVKHASETILRRISATLLKVSNFGPGLV